LLDLESQQIDGSFEDSGVRLHDTDVAGVDDTLNLHADPRTYLT
jgi:hypothetical protein